MLLTLLLLACQPQDGDLSGDHSALEIRQAEFVPNVFTVQWTGAPGEVFVEYGLDGALDQTTPVSVSADGEASVALMGLKAGRSYSAVAVSVDADGERHESAPLSVDVPLAPAELPSWATETFVDDLEPGVVLTAIAQPGSTYLLMLDRDGDVVWIFQFGSEYVVSSMTLSRDRAHVLALIGDKDQSEDIGSVYKIALDGDAMEITPTPLAHHDFMERPDGGVSWLAISMLPYEVDGHMVNVIGDEIRTEGPDGEPVTAFSVFDYFEQPWRACRHFDESVYGLDGHDWSHGNSLIAAEEEGQAYLGLRNLDALLKVDLDRSEVLWQLGGRDTEFSLVGPGRPWIHGHLSHAWDGGLMVFDNGPDEPNTVSRVVEYSVDVEARTYTELWTHDVPTGEHVEFFGDVQKLDDERVLVSWSTAGILEELSVDHQTRWSVQLSLGAVFGRMEWVGDLYAPTPL